MRAKRSLQVGRSFATIMRRWLLGSIIGVLLLGSFLASPMTWARAQDSSTPTPTPTDGPIRQTILNIDVDRYTWWLLRWDNNRVACTVVVEHPDAPTGVEVLNACGLDIYEDWEESAPCDQSLGDKSTCPGVYLHRVNQERVQKEVKIELPAPEGWVSLEGCQPEPPDNRCSSIPSLVISAKEPLPNESIMRIQGAFGSEPFPCTGETCVLPMRPTGPKGETVQFWADSSFGDSSQRYTALVRVLPWGDFMSPEGRRSDPRLYYVDVLSSQWRGQRPASCSDIWQALPDVGGLPTWLSSPQSAGELRSSISYYYLAGILIQNGAVDAGMCPNDGLQKDGVANACGVQVAMPEVLEWQNRFDAEIMQVSQDTGVPAQLVKNIFSRESQLWPGLYKTFREAGLGQLTSNGADTVLLWNSSFFDQFCPLVLSRDACRQGFLKLGEQEQNILRGALVQKVNAACADCPEGIDMTQANFSVGVFAEGLLANCEQVARIVRNVTEREPGQVSSYTDLWRFTLVNYNAGAGCLAEAVQTTYDNEDPLEWRYVSRNLEPACRGSVKYVADIVQVPGAAPTPTPWLAVNITPTPDTPYLDGDWTDEDSWDDEDYEDWEDEDWEDWEDEDWE